MGSTPISDLYLSFMRVAVSIKELEIMWRIFTFVIYSNEKIYLHKAIISFRFNMYLA